MLLLSWLKRTRFSGFNILFFIYFLLGVTLLTMCNLLWVTGEQHFVFLADAFLQGKLYFLEVPSRIGWIDTSFFNGHNYWPLGVFPSIILLPFVFIFGTSFLQGYVSFVLNLLVLYLLFRVAYKITGNKKTSRVLAFSYVFSTAYFMVAFAPFAWYFAHVVASLCIISAIYFTLVVNKPVYAGLFFAFSFLTRISAALGIPFFVLYYYVFHRKNWVRDLAKFLTPVLAGILIFFTYNYLRFGNIMEAGYTYQLLGTELAANRDIGMWSLKHFPAHLYIFLLKGPAAFLVRDTFVLQRIVPSNYGMSLVFTSPILLYLGLANMRKRLNAISLAGAILIAVFLFGSFGLGIRQYGYRFALDFQPFLFLILCDVFKKRKITSFILALVLASFVFNAAMSLLLLKSPS